MDPAMIQNIPVAQADFARKVHKHFMKTCLLFIAFICWPLHAFSSGFPSFTTKMAGVQLWELHADGTGFPYEVFEDGNNEFVGYCNGTREVYVSQFDSPVRCKSEAVDGGTYLIYLKVKDPRLSGLVVISKRPLPARARPLPLTTQENQRLIKAEEAPRAAFSEEAKQGNMESISTSGAAAWADRLRTIKTEANYRKYGGARYKIFSPSGFIFISAVGLFPNAIGWEIKNAVFREVDGELQEVGAFFGCIEGFRDLDRDGTPEVLAKTCDNSEAGSYTYYSVTPKVSLVVSRME